MKTRHILTGFLLMAAAAIAAPGCNDWLDVKPEDRVIDDQLFQSEEGFKLALNGIYIELNRQALYGGDLLFHTVEILAQRYDLSSSLQKDQLALAEFDYSTDYSRQRGEQIWQSAYELIMNVNQLLEQADRKRHLLSDKGYELITGEALALRAFLHLDLLRLFGPVYATGKDQPAIPYNSRFSLSGSDILTSSQVIGKVIDDLKEAEKRLANDPIIEEGPMNSDAEDDVNDWRYRSLRLNYYAVKALQARAYLYGQMPAEALEAARAVAAVQEKWFPFTAYTSIVGNSKTPDRVFSSELLFCMQNSKRTDIFTSYFSPDITSAEYIYAPKKRLDDIFGATKDADWRYSSTWIEPTNYDFRCFHKYASVSTTAFYANLIPLIRMTEVYYIIAETATDPAEALASINLVLENRGLPKLQSADQLTQTIASEYRKEFFGEGQLFFYYKRVNAPSIPSALSSSEIPMSPEKYRMPLPKSETDYRE